MRCDINPWFPAQDFAASRKEKETLQTRCGHGSHTVLLGAQRTERMSQKLCFAMANSESGTLTTLPEET
jgi:hypothetical protein